MTLGYLWYRFLLLVIEYYKSTKINRSDLLYDGQLISVIVPFFNENVKALRSTILSVLHAEGNKEVIVVDDGSDNPAGAEMVRREFAGRIKFIRYDVNRGKREAQAEGFKQVEGEFLVTVDSDTIIDPLALVKIINPLLVDPAVGGATGNVMVKNKNDNMLTKMIAARYWNAFNVERKGLSAFGIVTCCSGVLSAYRTKHVAKLMDPYINQTFMGTKCTFGDDRHLTNLLMMDDYRIKYVEDAICYTDAPTTYRQFFRQQLRWKKSFIRESLISMKFAFRHSFLLPIEILFNLIIPIWSIAIRIVLVYTLITYPVMIPAFIFAVATVAVIRNFFLFFEDKKLAVYTIPYAFVHELGLFWLYIVAMFSLNRTGWGTR